MDHTRTQQALQGELCGMHVRTDAPRDLARVQLLARRAHQQCERAAGRSAAPEQLSEDRHADMLQRSL